MTHSIINYPCAFISGMPGGGEIIVLFIIVLVLFGPRKLPEIAKMIGKTLDQLRSASHDFKDEIMKIEDEVKEDFKEVAKGAIDVESSDEMISFDDEYNEGGEGESGSEEQS